jgi:hypothetical protein
MNIDKDKKPRIWWNTKITICGENIVQVRHYEKYQGGVIGSNPNKDFSKLDKNEASGNLLRLFKNKEIIAIDKKIKDYVEKPPSLNVNKSEIDIHNKKKNGTKKRNKIINLINSNPQLNTFVTLTFKENIQDFDYAYKCFKKFNRKINEVMSETANKFEFVSVIEFQQRGAIHFHLLCNLETGFKRTKREFRKTDDQKYFEFLLMNYAWKYGFITVQPISNSNDNIGAYMVKYMTKEIDNDLTINKKMTSSSKGLCKPIEIKINDRNWKNEYDNLGIPNYQSNYFSDFTGNVQFLEYNNLKRIGELKIS